MIDKKIRVTSFANELGGLSQGVGDIVNRDNTIFNLAHEKNPTDRIKEVTYDQTVCNYRPQKDEPHCTRLVAGDNLIVFPGNVITITTKKVLFNVTISTKDARLLCCNI